MIYSPVLVTDLKTPASHRQRHIAISILALLFVAPAHADWQYTKWGMSADQVVSASSGTAAPAGKTYQFPNGSVMKVEGTFTSGAGTFDASFIFDAQGGLEQVNLGQADGAQCQNTLRLLTEKYGAAARPQNRVSIWRDESGGNVVEWMDNRSLADLSGGKENACTIMYKPLHDADSDL